MHDQRHYAGGTLRIVVWLFLFAVILQITSPAAKAQETLEPIKVATEVHSSFDSGGGFLITAWLARGEDLNATNLRRLVISASSFSFN